MSTLVIDKEILYEFLVMESSSIKEHHIEEVYKVIKIVLNKYHSKYFRWFEELESQIMQRFLERRERFDPKYDAYNYLFTIARNESGNYINKHSKEHLVDEFYSACVCMDTDIEVAPILTKYRDFLTGINTDKNYLRVSRDDALQLLLEYSNFNKSLNKVKRTFTQKEARQLYVLTKALLTK